jgi:hydrophobe/amphiphile efflux-3 (HAE3) family protein
MNPSNPTVDSSLVRRWFEFVVRRPRSVVALSLATLLLLAAPARTLYKDTSADAFIDPANPARVYRERVAATFGVTDPIVIAVVRDAPGGIYDRATLALVRELSERVSRLANVDPEKTLSLATESYIAGGGDGLEVANFLDDTPLTTERITWLRAAIADSPLYQGTLVARDGSATLVVAELLDEKAAPDTYRAIDGLVGRLAAPAGVTLHVAGEGAITGYLSEYIDADARQMIPVALLVITLVLYGTFRTWRATWMALVVVVGTVSGMLGLMAAAGVSYFAITSGLVAALIGIAVADTIHIVADWYERQVRDPTEPHAQRTVGTMVTMARPITVTSITTIAGFLTLWFTNTMPPIRWFGVFGAVGTALAWVYTVTLLPALLAWRPAAASPVIMRRAARLRERRAGTEEAASVGWVMALGRCVLRAPVATLVLAGLVAFAGTLGLTRLTVDYSRVDNFNARSALHVADEQLNARFAGGYHLDVVVETELDGGLYEPRVLRRIEALQRYALELPHVGGSLSIVDLVKQMNRAVAGDPSAYRLPETAEAAAQLFLLYSVSGDPTDFEEEIDGARRQALVRFYIDSPRWTDHAQIVQALGQYLAHEFAGDGVRGTLTGRVMVDHVWMQGIADSHFASVGVSLVAVLLLCALMFRSFTTALLCLVPVAVGVLSVYAMMGFGGIWLGVATSMFASVAIGLGVDFAIHSLERARVARATRAPGDDPAAWLLEIYRATGRPLLCNALAIALGFGAVALSQVPPVRYFGLLVAVGIVGSFLAALTVPPAVLALLARRGRARAPAAREALPVAPLYGLVPYAVAALLAAAALAPASTRAHGALDADSIMAAVAARPDGERISQTIRVELTDRHGVTRTERTRVFRRRVDGQRYTAVFYVEPFNVRGTAFLIHDHAEAGRADDQWLYLPALRKVRRIPPAQRGDWFLGTDLTYEEVKNDNKVVLADWRFRRLDDAIVDGASVAVVEGRPANEALARELGVGRAIWYIDPSVQMARRVDYWDLNGNPQKVVRNTEIRRIDGLWIATRIEVRNQKTGHGTRLIIDDVTVNPVIDDDLFTQQRLARGL